MAYNTGIRGGNVLPPGWPKVLDIDPTSGGFNPNILDGDSLIFGTDLDVDMSWNDGTSVLDITGGIWSYEVDQWVGTSTTQQNIDFIGGSSFSSRARFFGQLGRHGDIYIESINGDVWTFDYVGSASPNVLFTQSGGVGNLVNFNIEAFTLQLGPGSTANTNFILHGATNDGTMRWEDVPDNFGFDKDVEFDSAILVVGTTTFNTVAYTWPAADGSSGDQLTTDGAGNLSWATGLADTFLSLTDTPASYVGQATFFPQVNGGETALEFLDLFGTANTFSALQTFTGGIRLQDNQLITLGTGGDSTISFSGTNLVVNPDLVGSGVFEVAGGQEISEDGDLFMDTDGVVAANSSLTRVHLECGLEATNAAGTAVALGFACSGTSGVNTPNIIGAFGFGVTGPGAENHTEVNGVQGLCKTFTGYTGTLIRGSCFKALGLAFASTGDMRGFWADASVIGAGSVLTNWYAHRADNVAGNGNVTNQYGFFTEALTKGTALNYGSFVTSATTAAYASGSNNIAGGIAIGVAQNLEIYFTGSNAVIDPDNVTGGARVFIGVTGDDDMLLNEIEIDGDLNHDGTNIGFFGTAPVAQAAAYTPTNVTTDRSYDADATTVAELADVLGTLIADLQAYGLLQ